MRKTLGSLLMVLIICLFVLNGTCFAEENGVSISLDSPASSQAISPGDDVEISGKASNVQQVSLVVFNPKGSIAYVAQPSVFNGTFTTGFQLNSDALEGIYTIKIGAEGLGAPLVFTFGVSKDNSSVPPGGSTTPGGVSPTTGGGGSGGGVSPNPEAITGNSEAGVTASTGTQNFNDTNGHWASSSISQLVALGAINGYPDGSFRPEKTISRAEFAAVLVKAFNLNQQSSATFKDTVNHWARNHIAAAVASGVANGYNADTFGPDDPVTREQMAVMIVRAAGIAGAAEEPGFNDSADISVWAREAIAAMTQKGLMQGYSDNTIQPLKYAKRGEAVTLIMNVLNSR